MFAAPRAAVDRLRRELAPRSATKPAARDAAWPALAHLERNLFRRYRDLESPTSAVLGSVDRVHIVAASGVHAEIVEIGTA